MEEKKESRRSIEKMNLLELEKALMQIQNEMSLCDHSAEVVEITVDDEKGKKILGKNRYQILSEQYNALWQIKIGLEKNSIDKKKIIAGICTPIVGLLAAWAGRELLQSAFWRDIAREVTKMKF